MKKIIPIGLVMIMLVLPVAAYGYVNPYTYNQFNNYESYSNKYSYGFTDYRGYSYQYGYAAGYDRYAPGTWASGQRAQDVWPSQWFGTNYKQMNERTYFTATQKYNHAYTSGYRNQYNNQYNTQTIAQYGLPYTNSRFIPAWKKQYYTH